MPRSLDMGKITPAQLRTETRLVVERIRDVQQAIVAAGAPASWGDYAAFRNAARTARETFEGRPDADTREVRELLALATAIEGLAGAMLCELEADPPELANLAVYAFVIGPVLARLAFRAGVLLTVPATGDEGPATGPLN